MRWLEEQHLKVYLSRWNSSDLVKSATRRAKNTNLLTPTNLQLIHATDSRTGMIAIGACAGGYLCVRRSVSRLPGTCAGCRGWSECTVARDGSDSPAAH